MFNKSMSTWQNKGGYSYANCNGITKRVGKNELNSYKMLANKRHSFWVDNTGKGECLQISLIHLHKKFRG